MKERNRKIELLLSLIRKAHGYLIITERDESGNKVVISKKPFDGDTDIEFEFVSNQYSPTNREEDVQD